MYSVGYFLTELPIGISAETVLNNILLSTLVINITLIGAIDLINPFSSDGTLITADFCCCYS